MNKIISAASAAVVFAMSAGVALAPASAAGLMGRSNFQQQDQYIGNFCANNPRSSQCSDWQTNHSRWSNSQYQTFYRSHQRDNGFGGSAVAALFGVALGSALVHAGSTTHVTACQNAYRSYSVQSDSYLGYDGARHLCRI